MDGGEGPKAKDHETPETKGGTDINEDVKENGTGTKGFKYPLQAPAPEVVERVRQLVEEAEPPRYEDQVGGRSKRPAVPKGRKQAQEEEEEDEEGGHVDPEEVMSGMEKMCLEEARKEAEVGDFVARMCLYHVAIIHIHIYIYIYMGRLQRRRRRRKRRRKTHGKRMHGKRRRRSRKRK